MGLSLMLVLCLSIFTFLSASTSISDHIFRLQAGLTERRLLQAHKRCPVDFEHKNYSIITSKCINGPSYETTPCCSALKEFACPFVDELNDLTNDCASVMFGYIRLMGHYPAGLFSSLCREGMEGLACPDIVQAKNTTINAAAAAAGTQLIMTTTCHDDQLFMIMAAAIITWMSLHFYNYI